MNLVVQGPALERSDVDAVAAMVKAAEVVPLAERVFRLKRAQRADIASWCEQRRIDHAWVPEGAICSASAATLPR